MKASNVASSEVSLPGRSNAQGVSPSRSNMKSKPIHRPPSVLPFADSAGTVAKESGSNAAHGKPFLLKQILVPIDFSEDSLRALEYALGLAEPFRAKVVLLHVVEPAVSLANSLMTPAMLEETTQGLVSTARSRLDDFHPRVPILTVESLVRVGRAHSEIADTASATGSNLIVMSARREPSHQPPALSSTAERVLFHAPCPVLILPRA